MKLSEQKLYLKEKKKKTFLKSNLNRESTAKQKYYLEGSEINILEEKLIKAYTYENLSGWHLTFLSSMIEKIKNRTGEILILSEKQIEQVEFLAKAYILGLKSTEDKEKEEMKLQKEGKGFFFKKVK